MSNFDFRDVVCSDCNCEYDSVHSSKCPRCGCKGGSLLREERVRDIEYMVSSLPLSTLTTLFSEKEVRKLLSSSIKYISLEEVTSIYNKLYRVLSSKQKKNLEYTNMYISGEISLEEWTDKTK